MPEDPATWFIQNKVAKGLVFVDPASLLPQRLTRRWCYPTHDDIAHFTFSVA
ncbi:hypothetical protein GCM10007160_39320 [Litchfieldella qijiaojingensis]|uniref:Uncharacterized protein n=1 Tax=Litchfieldella qijiaojingensis TaxID=980347 RepID=A0ABQ2Z844_9GAMM|nr:hypothetical protein GCM10007160_39320 [Halomonas qijiaojingensis]